jgi:predicted dinucleotide-binding enzyme
MGTRDVAAAMARAEPDRFGNPPLPTWLEANQDLRLATFADAAAEADVIINAVNGQASLAALAAAGEANLAGKLILDVANPLDFSAGMPPTLSVSNTDSLAEQIQRQFPAAHVVKTLNTVTAMLMVNPDLVAGGDHTIFVSGNDETAKQRTSALLAELGWRDVMDLGDLSSARATEMYLPLWLRLFGVLGTPMFSIKVER